ICMTCSNPQSEIHNPQLAFAMRPLFLHVPFGQRPCSYCDFSIAVRKHIPAREYVDAVLGELAAVCPADPGREPGDFGGESLDTLYLGGGTPSLLPPDAISALLTSLRDAFHVTSSREDRKSTRLNSSHEWISYAVFCLKK